jgi:hypothetical protein
VQQHTHVTARLGRHIFVCFCNKHCGVLDLGVCLAVSRARRLWK